MGEICKKRIESIVNKLSKASNSLTKSLPEHKRLYDHWRFFGRDGLHSYLVGEGLDTYNKLLEKLMNWEGWSEKFSESYIDKMLQDAMISILRDGIQKGREEFERIYCEMEAYSIEQKVYIPLSGIQMYDIEEISLGRVIIKRFSENEFKKIIESVNSITRSSEYTQEEQDFLVRETNDQLAREIFNKVCSIFTVTADPIRARELAEQETQRALDLLRLSIPLISPGCERIRIGLSSQVPYSFQPSLTLSSTITSPTSFVRNRRRLTHGYVLSKSTLEILKKHHVFELSEILRKNYNQINDFEKILLRGVHWFASSQSQVELENEFLNLITCLEVFLTPKDGDPISNSIAEGVAFILGESLVERKRLKKLIGCVSPS